MRLQIARYISVVVGSYNGYKVELNKYTFVGVSYKVRIGVYMRVFK